jgi:hypothetical protein
LASQHPTESRPIVGQQGPRRLWPLVRERRPPDKQRSVSRPLAVGQGIGRKAHPFLAGRAQVHREPWQHERAVARIAAAMSDKRVPAIYELAFERDGARVGVPTSCNVTRP